MLLDLHPSPAVAMFLMVRVVERWDPVKHPRIPKGLPDGGQFLDLDERMQLSLHTGGDLDGFSRPQLMSVAKDRGIYRRKGVTEPELRAAIEKDIKAKGVSDRAKALAKALDEAGDRPKVPAKKAAPTTPDGMPDLDRMTVPQLKAYAAERGIQVKALTRKPDLVAHIRRMEGGAAKGHARLQGVDPDGPMPPGRGAPKVPAVKAAKAATKPEVPKSGGAKAGADRVDAIDRRLHQITGSLLAYSSVGNASRLKLFQEQQRLNAEREKLIASGVPDPNLIRPADEAATRQARERISALRRDLDYELGSLIQDGRGRHPKEESDLEDRIGAVNELNRLAHRLDPAEIDRVLEQLRKPGGAARTPAKRAPRAPKVAKPDSARVSADFADAVKRPMPSDRDRFKTELGALTGAQLSEIAVAHGVKLPAGTKQKKADWLVERLMGGGGPKA